MLDEPGILVHIRWAPTWVSILMRRDCIRLFVIETCFNLYLLPRLDSCKLHYLSKILMNQIHPKRELIPTWGGFIGRLFHSREVKNLCKKFSFDLKCFEHRTMNSNSCQPLPLLIAYGEVRRVIRRSRSISRILLVWGIAQEIEMFYCFVFISSLVGTWYVICFCNCVFCASHRNVSDRSNERNLVFRKSDFFYRNRRPCLSIIVKWRKFCVFVKKKWEVCWEKWALDSTIVRSFR